MVSVITGLPLFGAAQLYIRSSGGGKTRGSGTEKRCSRSQMVSYDFPLHGPLHEYFLPRRRCKPEECYLGCSKQFDHRSHSFFLVRV